MIYTIKNEYLTLTVSSHGAEKQTLISNKGVSYLRDTDEFWNRHAPLLFPIVGKLRDLKTIINNREYHMGQHGFIRDSEFDLESITESTITLSNTYSNETLEMYPFKYKVLVTYSLESKTLITSFKVINLDYQVIPFNFGGHPGFKVPLFENEKFEDYTIKFPIEENFDAPSVIPSNGTLDFDHTIKYRHIKDLKLDYKYFLIDAIVIPNVKSKEVMLVNKDNKGIKFEYPNFPTLAIWTKPNAPFVCLEPWIGNADKYNSNYHFIEKNDMVFLNPEEEYEAKYKITILD